VLDAHHDRPQRRGQPIAPAGEGGRPTRVVGHDFHRVATARPGQFHAGVPGLQHLQRHLPPVGGGKVLHRHPPGGRLQGVAGEQRGSGPEDTGEAPPGQGRIADGLRVHPRLYQALPKTRIHAGESTRTG